MRKEYYLFNKEDFSKSTDFFIVKGGRGGIYNDIYRALQMLNSWLDDGEVSGTGHYISPHNDPEEYHNLVLIKRLLIKILEGEIKL